MIYRINSPSPEKQFHHFRFKEVPELGLYIPYSLHNSIYHNHKTGKGMKEMNKAALLWLCEQSIIEPDSDGHKPKVGNRDVKNPRVNCPSCGFTLYTAYVRVELPSEGGQRRRTNKAFGLVCVNPECDFCEKFKPENSGSSEKQA